VLDPASTTSTITHSITKTTCQTGLLNALANVGTNYTEEQRPNSNSTTADMYYRIIALFRVVHITIEKNKLLNFNVAPVHIVLHMKINFHAKFGKTCL